MKNDYQTNTTEGAASFEAYYGQGDSVDYPSLSELREPGQCENDCENCGADCPCEAINIQ